MNIINTPTPQPYKVRKGAYGAYTAYQVYQDDDISGDLSLAVPTAANTNEAGDTVSVAFDMTLDAGTYSPVILVNGMEDTVLDVVIVNMKDMLIDVATAIISTDVVTISMPQTGNVAEISLYPVTNLAIA